jgi:predicted MarR family transcription regulator
MKKNTFCKIYWDIFGEFDLSPIEGLLLSLIHGLSRSKGYCYASKQTLADLLNVTDICIYGVIARLEEDGLIERTGITDKKTMGLMVTLPVSDFISDQEVGHQPPNEN